MDYEDIEKKNPVARYIPRKILDIYLKLHWPIIGSIVKFRRETYSDYYGYIIICPLTPKQMIKNPDLAIKKIYRSAKYADKLGSKIIGLGAFTSILTHDGKDLAGKISSYITTGNTYAAVLALQTMYKIAKIANICIKNITVGVIGAAGSVGSGCAKFLARRVGKLILVDINYQLLKELFKNVSSNVFLTNDITQIKDAQIIFTVTNTPGAILLPKHVSKGTVVIDAAQPKNVSQEITKYRNDILVIESGIAEVEGLDYDMDLGLYKNETFACLAELLILACLGAKKNYLGKVDVSDIEKIWEYADNLCFRPAKFRNRRGFISDDQIEHFINNNMRRRIN